MICLFLLLLQTSLTDQITAELAKGQDDQLLTAYRTLRADGPDANDENELNDLGYALLNQGSGRNAIVVFKLATAVFPDKANPQDSLAEAYLLTGEYDLAVNHYQIAFDKSGDRSIWRRLATAIKASGNRDKALQYAQRGITQFKDSEAYDVAFVMQLEFEALADPITEFKQLQKANPKHGFWRSRDALNDRAHEVEDLQDGWQQGAPEVHALIQGQLKAALADQQYENLHGVVVAQGPKILFEGYFEGYTRYRPHDTRSAGKSISALIAGIAMDKSRLTLNSKLYDFFPEYREKPTWDARKDGILFKHLLGMSSGLDAFDDRPSPGNENTYQQRQSDWIDYGLQLPYSFEPGSQLVYASANYLLVGAIIQRATQIPLHQFAQKRLFSPLSIHDFQWFRDPKNNAYAAGGIALTPRDMAKLGRLVLKNGAYQGQQIVPQSWIEKVKVPAAEGNLFHKNYSYGWYIHQEEIRDQTVDIVSAGGNGGQRIYLVPALDAVIVTTMGNYNTDKQWHADHLIVNLLIPAVMDQERASE